ncbi:ATP-grasp domain-containing protein [Algibacter mikhailovii]|uniref:ATP-grasp domain-containing protein n=1 Tax=Algibacter mikhailovii TaxID=425498 RepID=A0A918V416_9FLAO|nr:ATP-grasp domain-containing protein [Algibacter mikhailovii]GGZ68907.1 hypothetical protein GCM10007028_02300 [Algibacter mikhailovii]
MAKNLKNISVLIPDGETHVLLYVVNCLSLEKGVDIYVISSKKKGYMKYSRFIKKYIYYPETTTEDWIAHINSEVERHQIDIVLPIYYNGIKALLKNRNKLKYPDKLCDLPSLKNFSIAGNKGFLFLHLKKHNILCPDSLIVNQSHLPIVVNLSFPVIIKPVEDYGGGEGIAIVKTHEELINYFKANNFKCDTIIQEYIVGYDLCCNVLCKDGELIAHSIQKATVFRKGHLTPQIGFDFIENQDLIELTRNLMRSLNWSGIANVDLRFDEKNNVFKILEINTRFWLGTDASSIAGVNFPYLYCLSSLGQKPGSQQIIPMSYLSLEGLAKRFKKNPFFIFNLKYIFKYSPISFIIKDPLPIVFKALSVVKLQ